MRWPLRWQLLIPIAGLVCAGVVINALSAAWSATVRQERAMAARLEQAATVLGAAHFPLTSAVLERLQRLTGAHAAVWNEATQTVTASTMPIERPAAIVRQIRAAVHRQRLPPVVIVGGQSYRALIVQPSRPDGRDTLLLLYPDIELAREQRAAVWPAALVGLMTLAVLIPLTDVLARRFSQRIVRVQEKVAAVAGGDFTPLAEHGADDEVRQLIRGVNEMSARLAELQARIERDERSRLLAQFASGLAHHLRNAIAGARLAVEIHRKRCQVASHDDSLAVALRQLALVEQQVRGALSLGGTSRPERIHGDTTRLLQEALDLVGPTAMHWQVSLDAAYPDVPHSAMVDGDGVRAALSNLLLNAVEAAGHGGKVHCRMIATPQRITWEIRDSGPGPSAAVQDRLGTPFVTGKPDGVGLGLAFARQLAEDHGGRLEWSRANGQTCFTWWIAIE